MIRTSLTKRDLLKLGGVTTAAFLAAGPLGLLRPAFAAPSVGAPAPDFSLPGSDGNTHSLADYRGKTVILEWTNHGCPYVRKHYGTDNMQTLQRETTAAGMVWLSIISSPPGAQGHVEAAEANELTVSRKAAPTAVLFDPNGKAGRTYGAQVTPHMYIIDPQGSLVYMGGIDDKPTSNPADVPNATNYVRAALDDLAAGRPVANPMTRAYGCVIRYRSEAA